MRRIYLSAFVSCSLVSLKVVISFSQLFSLSSAERMLVFGSKRFFVAYQLSVLSSLIERYNSNFIVKDLQIFDYEVGIITLYQTWKISTHLSLFFKDNSPYKKDNRSS
jgi:hypothetical protein